MRSVILAFAAVAMFGQQPPPQQQAPPTPPPTVVTRDGFVVVGPNGPGPAANRPPLPPLTPDAKNLIDQLKQAQTSTIEQLRYLQQSYRDSGRAEDAGVIAAYVRQLQQRTPNPTGVVTADLVNEGLQTRDDPVRMSNFRARAGDTLSFAIRGRDDQPVWGTTTYTDDSALESAAVHAGMLRVGQSGIVKVKVLPGLDKYDSTAQNGVRSTAYGHHEGSFRFTAVAVTVPTRTSSLSSYRDLLGSSIVLPIVGTTGNVWGSDVYTDDSSVAAAAVHAGILNVGDFGFVKVTLMPGQSRYEGSARNGITSQPYEIFDGSFRIDSAPPGTTQLPGGEDASRLIPMDALRGRTDVSFVVQIKGTTNGPVWGTGIYTDDSSIAAAAVHAGLIKVDEIGLVRVTIVPGRQSCTPPAPCYAASEANGVKSQPYGPWEGSFRIERVR